VALRAAVIGAGLIAGQHLACLRELRNAETVGVCDISPSVAEAAAERYGIPAWFTDHQRMLMEVRPDVVHVLTPPPTHYELAAAALAAGAHAIVEKPITSNLDELAELIRMARAGNRRLLEDYSYIFNPPVQRVFNLIRSGQFGEVVQVQVTIALDIVSLGHPFTDPSAPHAVWELAGGAISDFIPHLASLAYFLVGDHRGVATIWKKRSSKSVPIAYDEFRALVDGERGSAFLSFSAHSQPDAMWLRVDGTRMRAAVSIYEGRMTTERLRGGPSPLVPLLNGLAEARDVGRGAIGSLVDKLAGRPGDYEGVWELLRRTYDSLNANEPPPISLEQIEAVNRLIADLTDTELRL